MSGYEGKDITAIINTTQFGKVKIFVKNGLASITNSPMYELVN